MEIMKHAKDISGKIVEISKADRGGQYYCIACGEEVKAKKGSKKSYYSHLINIMDYSCDEKVKNILEFKEEVLIKEDHTIKDINSDLFDNKYNNGCIVTGKQIGRAHV